MGIDVTTYLGPYFECKVERTTRVSSYRGCPTPGCRLCAKEVGESTIYCSRCGSGIVTLSKSACVDAIDWDEVREALHDSFYLAMGDDLGRWMRDEGVHIWIENRDIRESGGKSFDPCSHSIWYVVDAETLTRETIRLHEKCKIELEILRKFYGEDNVKIKWGLLSMIH